MFASQFGMNGSPFRLSPDPRFYFDSHGHHRALAALRRGLSEASGFTILSGEIGAGKTTVVRAVLRELNPAFFAVAQIVSTQLDAEELLRALAIGFGLPGTAGGLMDLAASLRRFLADLRARRRRAILVIDEAQNLCPDALDQLTSFAMRGAPGGRGMQICLVGQPQLQTMMGAAGMLAVREQVCVSCHLGPIERGEVGPYVVHRLHKVGWQGQPGFDAAAFDEIYRWSSGIPRRINTLCGRLLSTCLTSGQTMVVPAMVEEVARDQRAELGEATVELPVLLSAVAHPVVLPSPAKPGPALCVVAGLGDHVRAAALMAAMAERAGWSSVKLVRVVDNDSLALSDGLFDGLDMATDLVSLAGTDKSSGAGPTELEDRFRRLIRRTSPVAVIAFGANDTLLACCAIARRRGVLVVHIGPDLPSDDAGAGEAGVGESSGWPADVWYVTDERAGQALADKGIALSRIHCVGDLVIDAVRLALRSFRDPGLCGSHHRIVVPLSDGMGPYALVSIEQPGHVHDRQRAVALISFLRRISRSLALVLVMRDDVGRDFDGHGFDRAILGERMCRLPAQNHGTWIDLLRHAACVISDSALARQEALALGIPGLAISVESDPVAAEAETNGAMVKQGFPPAGRMVYRCSITTPDGDPPLSAAAPVGPRIAEHLGILLGLFRDPSLRLVTDGNRELMHERLGRGPSPKG